MIDRAHISVPLPSGSRLGRHFIKAYKVHRSELDVNRRDILFKIVAAFGARNRVHSVCPANGRRGSFREAEIAPCPAAPGRPLRLLCPQWARLYPRGVECSVFHPVNPFGDC